MKSYTEVERGSRGLNLHSSSYQYFSKVKVVCECHSSHFTSTLDNDFLSNGTLIHQVKENLLYNYVPPTLWKEGLNMGVMLRWPQTLVHIVYY